MTEEVKLIDEKSIEKLEVADGDALIVTLPEAASIMSEEMRTNYIKSIQESFEDIFQDKKVRVVIIPHGMKVELVLTSELGDEEDA